MAGLVAAMRAVLAEEERVQRRKRDLYREARALGLSIGELRRRSGADRGRG